MILKDLRRLKQIEENKVKRWKKKDVGPQQSSIIFYYYRSPAVHIVTSSNMLDR